MFMILGHCDIEQQAIIIRNMYGSRPLSKQIHFAGAPYIVMDSLSDGSQYLFNQANYTDSYEFNFFEIIVPAGHYIMHLSSYLSPACQFRIYETSDYLVDFGFTERPKDELESRAAIFGTLQCTVLLIIEPPTNRAPCFWRFEKK